jgi:hypothetical protein
MNFQDALLALPSFSLNDEQKKVIFLRSIKKAFLFHWRNCPEFKYYCQKQGFSVHNPLERLADYPYLPVALFKSRKMISVPEETITAQIVSSGTSGKPSTILVDAGTTRRQTVTATKIIADFIGSHRRPFLVLDVDPSIVRSKVISARTAATRGFLIFASSVEYCLTENKVTLSVDDKKMLSCLKQAEFEGKEIIIFGFTFILYHHMIKMLKDRNVRFKLSDSARILHIGGWKKLESQKVSRKQFLDDIFLTLGVKSSHVYDFYGFTEQMGLVYGNRADWPKTVPLYAEIIIRDPLTLEPAEEGRNGFIRVDWASSKSGNSRLWRYSGRDCGINAHADFSIHLQAGKANLLEY